MTRSIKPLMSWVVLFAAAAGLALNAWSTVSASEAGQGAGTRTAAVGAPLAEEADRLHSLAVRLTAQYKYEEAVPLLEKAISIKERTLDENHESLALSLEWLGATYRHLGEYENAVDHYSRSLAIYQNSGSLDDEARVLNLIALPLLRLSRYGESIEYHKLALSLARRIGNEEEAASALAGLGHNYIHTGEYELAIDSFTQSLESYKGIGSRHGEARTLLALGEGYYYLAQYHKAIEYFQESLAMARELGHESIEATNLNDLGLTYYEIEDYEKAIEHLDQALALARKLKRVWGETTAVNNLALAYEELGQHEKAIEHFEQALELARRAKNRFAEAGALGNIGRAYSKMERYAKAIDYQQRALPISREIGHRYTQATLLQRLMYYWKALDEPRLAIFYGKQSVNVYQQMRGNISGLEEESQGAFLTSKEHVYRLLADLLIAEGRLPEARQILDMLKEEEYFQFVRRDESEAGKLDKRANLTPAEEKWHERYVETSERLAATGKEYGELVSKAGQTSLTAQEEARLLQLETNLIAAREAFEHFLDELEKDLGGERGRDKVFQIEETRGLMSDLRELGQGVVAVYTLVSADQYRAILITPEVQIAEQYPITSAELNRKISAFRDTLQNPGADPRPMARELYDILVAPLSGHLADANASTLMWSLDGALRYVPMAALYDGERFLVERFRNVVFTPASQARLKDEPSASWRALGLGVSEGYEDFAPLPGVKEELEEIIRAPGRVDGVLPGAIKLDHTFTKKDMRQELRKRYPLVHIASHFKFQPGNETDSFLLLGDGSHLSLAEIKSLPNVFGGVELLTLSACDTATGGTGANGEEVEGFGVLAQRQGAKAVMASLWPVSDDSTKQLMKEFYALRESEKLSKAEALRKAQMAMLNGNGTAAEGGGRRGVSLDLDDDEAFGFAYTHPYYWAPFILIGNWK